MLKFWTLFLCLVLPLGLGAKAMANECPAEVRSNIQKSAEKLLPTTAVVHGEGHFLQHLNHLPGQSGEKRLAFILTPQRLELSGIPETLGIMLSPFELRGHLTPVRSPLGLPVFRPGVFLKHPKMNCHWAPENRTFRITLPSFSRGKIGWKKIELTFKKEKLERDGPMLPQKLKFQWPEHSRSYVVHYNQWMRISKDMWFATKMQLESFLLRNGNRSETAKLNLTRIKPWVSRELLEGLKKERENSQFQVYDQVLFPKHLKTQYSKDFVKKLKEEIERPFPPFSKEKLPEIIHL